MVMCIFDSVIFIATEKIATIASPIIGVFSIIVALYISYKSSKDILKLIETEKTESANKINAMRKSSINEIKQIRILIHTLLVAIIHKLETDNLEIKSREQELFDEITPLIARYEKIKEWRIVDENDINLADVNSHSSEMADILSSMLSIINKYNLLHTQCTSISKGLERLKSPIEEYCKTN